MSYHWTRLELAARPVERAKDPLTEPTWWELPAILVLVAILAANEIWDWRAEDTLNIVAPVWLSLAVGAGALKMANVDGRAVWTPLFWFRVATLIFYGLGNIAPVIMNGATLEYAQSLYFFLPEDLLRVNLNTAVGVGAILFGSLMFERMFVTTRVATVKRAALRSPGGAARMGTALFLIGAAINYFFILPNLLGASDTVIPGFVVSLAMSELVGLSLLAIWACATSKAAVLAIVAVVAVESAVGVLFLNKTMALMAWFAFVIGALCYNLTIPRLATAGLLVYFAFGILQPLVAYGRNEAFNNPANRGAEMSLFRNFEYLRSYFVESKAENDPEAVQGGLMRLTLVNVAAFTIAQYDHGLPGDSIRNAWVVFVPRFLWPEKPLLLSGFELATLATGGVGNSISAGYFAETYWNFGWVGLVLLMFPVGAFFNWTTHFAARALAREDWIYAPLLFFNLKMSLEIGSAYSGFIGAAAQSFAIQIMLYFVGRLLRSTGLLRPLESGA